MLWKTWVAYCVKSCMCMSKSENITNPVLASAVIWIWVWWWTLLSLKQWKLYFPDCPMLSPILSVWQTCKLVGYGWYLSVCHSKALNVDLWLTACIHFYDVVSKMFFFLRRAEFLSIRAFNLTLNGVTYAFNPSTFTSDVPQIRIHESE